MNESCFHKKTPISAVRLIFLKVNVNKNPLFSLSTTPWKPQLYTKIVLRNGCCTAYSTQVLYICSSFKLESLIYVVELWLMAFFPFQLGPKEEDVSKPVNRFVFLYRLLLGALAGAYYVLVPIYMWLKDQIIPKGQPIWEAALRINPFPLCYQRCVFCTLWKWTCNFASCLSSNDAGG